MTKDEFKQREALYKHLLKLKVPGALAEMIAIRTRLQFINYRSSFVKDYLLFGFIRWDLRNIGSDFWEGVYKDAKACK